MTLTPRLIERIERAQGILNHPTRPKRKQMTQHRSIGYMTDATLALVIALALVVIGFIGLLEMAKPGRVPEAKVVNAKWMSGVRDSAAKINRGL